MPKDNGKNLHIGVYAPFLQGFFFGEIIGQLQNFCQIKQYRFSLIQTNSVGEFSSSIHTEHLDIIIVLRNAISNDLASALLEQGKTIVSVAYDYAPLDIPFVSSENTVGMEIAFTHLKEQGHENLAFIGDTSHFDIRKRYDAFCKLHERNDYDLPEENIFIVDDALFSGGYKAAETFILTNNQATGIICGAGLTALGFSHQLDLLAPDIHQDIEIIGFDSLSLLPICDNNIASIDQNLHLIAHKAIEIAEQRYSGNKTAHIHTIEPKLIASGDGTSSNESTYIAMSIEAEELQNPNYMKSIIVNSYEWPKEISRSNLDKLMMLSPLFPKYLQKAAFSRVGLNSEGVEFVKLVKVHSQDSLTKLEKEKPKLHL